MRETFCTKAVWHFKIPAPLISIRENQALLLQAEWRLWPGQETQHFLLHFHLDDASPEQVEVFKGSIKRKLKDTGLEVVSAISLLESIVDIRLQMEPLEDDLQTACAITEDVFNRLKLEQNPRMFEPEVSQEKFFIDGEP